ncbi:syntaxin-binding protein 4-like isoform X1 [Acipenser ruthenus]|uniref:syntaxin-binding protein 4-like isoform X1 n=2 Tax=Acipenser ruthenus TaxID=7906 RepID=UPI00274192D1|nr:syntaxin-binding protein 4-like isoform X1 [Acipenser ruthenus]
MSLLPHDEAEPERFDGLSLLYWMMMGPHGINRAVQRLVFSRCQHGLGVKIIGGYREHTGEEYGIYIKRILPGGVADRDGRLQPGDLVLDVNNESLGGVTNERAVDILRMASASNHISLLIARDEESKRVFRELLEKNGSHSNAGSERNSPTPLAAGKMTESTSSTSSSSRSQSPQLLSPKDIVTSYCNSYGVVPVANDNAIQLICVAKGTGLGLHIVGGANRPEGPMVYVQETVSGGACQKDGRLRPGDQIVSVNKESFIGVTYEEANSILTQTKLRPDPTVEIAFIRRSSGKGLQSPVGLQPQVKGNGNLLRPTGLGLHSPPGNLIPKMSSTPNTGSETLPSVKLSQIRAAPKRRDESPVLSPDSTLPEEPGSAISPSPMEGCTPKGRKISLNSTIRLKLDRLQQALGYLGIRPTEEQERALREQLQIDSKGTVAYGEFVQVVRDLFKLQLDDAGIGQGMMRFAATDLTNLLEPTHQPQLAASDSEELDEMERLKRDRIEALREARRLQDQLAESEGLRAQLQEELKKVKQHVAVKEAKAAVEETRALRSRIHLAEATQKQARGMEMDYEEVIRLLEAEIAELKAPRTDQPNSIKDGVQDLKKRVAVLECQLRKSEGAKKGFEVSTEKLLQFVEVVHDVLAENPSFSSPSDWKLGMTSSSQAIASRIGRKGPRTTTALAQEAKDLSRSVRSILEVDCLPYGWEEAYTADGIKYYINHVTQTTSWVHPVTSGLGLSHSERDGEDVTRDLQEHRS